MTLIEKGKAIQSYIAYKELTQVDRWGHVKFDKIVYGKGIETYRYKLCTNVIRLEVKLSDGNWCRLKSYSVNKLYKNLESKIKELDGELIKC